MRVERAAELEGPSGPAAIVASAAAPSVAPERRYSMHLGGIVSGIRADRALAFEFYEVERGGRRASIGFHLARKILQRSSS